MHTKACTLVLTLRTYCYCYYCCHYLLLLLLLQVDCVEAIYNLGLVNIQLKLVGDALQAFEKLHTILPTSAEVVYHIANLHQHSRDDLAAAAKWFNILLARTPTVSSLNLTFTLLSTSVLPMSYSMPARAVTVYALYHASFENALSGVSSGYSA
eukprot:2737-Heterococcus_DN1.PRE.1